MALRFFLGLLFWPLFWWSGLLPFLVSLVEGPFLLAEFCGGVFLGRGVLNAVVRGVCNPRCGGLGFPWGLCLFGGNPGVS